MTPARKRTLDLFSRLTDEDQELLVASRDPVRAALNAIARVPYQRLAELAGALPFDLAQEIRNRGTR